MKARGNRGIQVIDPEESALNDDPLWAPSWDLPGQPQEGNDRGEDAPELHVERDALDRLSEGINPAR